ncbi:tetratricopeptide repeat protein [Clostridium neuense]|uniref:Tetratricopeptide repeat protein n=1 Tax=Clostridium neuense TaxID=1728934 RepID=A0ABW8TF04_9CLOT
MKKWSVNKKLILLALIAFSVLITGCTHKDKETVLTCNVKENETHKLNQINKNISLGNNMLDSGKYAEARKAYDSAIKLDKKNKKTYITIENKYLEKDKLDDACSILEEAIDNNVDVANMKKLLAVVKQKIDSKKEASNVVTKRDIDKKNNINSVDNVNKPTSDANAENSPNSIKNTMPKITKEFVRIKDVYEKDGNRYILFCRDKIYMGDEAKAQAKKDGINNWYSNCYFVKNPYDVASYKVSDSCTFNIGGYIINYPATADRTNHSVNYDTFEKSVVNVVNVRGNESITPINLYWITLKDGVVVQIDSQDRN